MTTGKHPGRQRTPGKGSDALDKVQQRSARKNPKRQTGMLILGRHRDARRDSTRGSHRCARNCCPLSAQIVEMFGWPKQIGNPRLQILLLTLVVDQTQVFPSATLLFLSSTGRCQIPKTAVAAGGLLVRSPNDMPNAKGGVKTHLSEARRKTNRKTNTQTYYEKHCATVATFQWPGAYVLAHGKSHQYSISHALSQSPLGAELHKTGQHTRYLVGLRGKDQSSRVIKEEPSTGNRNTKDMA